MQVATSKTMSQLIFVRETHTLHKHIYVIHNQNYLHFIYESFGHLQQNVTNELILQSTIVHRSTTVNYDIRIDRF